MLRIARNFSLSVTLLLLIGLLLGFGALSSTSVLAQPPGPEQSHEQSPAQATPSGNVPGPATDGVGVVMPPMATPENNPSVQSAQPKSPPPVVPMSGPQPEFTPAPVTAETEIETVGNSTNAGTSGTFVGQPATAVPTAEPDPTHAAPVAVQLPTLPVTIPTVDEVARQIEVRFRQAKRAVTAVAPGLNQDWMIILLGIVALIILISAVQFVLQLIATLRWQRRIRPFVNNTTTSDPAPDPVSQSNLEY